MAYINKDIPTMAMPKSFDRMGQFPLDMSSVFYNKEELENYASSNPIAYVGQIVSLVDEDNKKVTVYSIQNVEGDLQELGTVSDVSKYLAGTGIVIGEDNTISVDVDNETIEIVDGKLSAVIPDYADTDTKTNIVSGDSYISIEGSLIENDSNTFTISIDESELKTLIGATTTAAMEFKGVTDELKPLADKGDLYKVTSIIVVEEDDDAEGKGFIANVGDSIVSDGTGKWYLIPSGDDVEDTNDTYSAGNGIVISEANENSDHTVSIKLGENEEYLKFENGALLFDPTGIDTDTNTTYTISAQDATITLTPSEGDAQNVTLNVYTKGQTDQAIANKINEVNGGQSAGEVLVNLNAYKQNIDTEIWGPEKVAEWTVETDGKTNYSPDYTATSRIDTLIAELNSLTIDHIANLANELDNRINKTDVNSAQFEWINAQLSIKTIDSSLISGLDDLLNAKADASAITNLESLLDNKASVSSVSDLEDALNNYKTTTDARLDALEEAMTWGEMSDTVE